MKRFVAIALCLLFLAIGGYWLIYQSGIYLPGRDTAAEPAFRTAEGYFVKGEDASDTALLLRAVEISSAYPGYQFSDYALSQADYERYLTLAADMGATAVMVDHRMDDDFYKAFAAYNEKAQEPLYLIQGISVADSLTEAAGSAYGTGLFESLIREGKLLVDVIHGKRDVFSAGIGGSGFYRDDISAWVVGMLLTAQVSADTVAYTDHSVLYQNRYEGSYFSTGSEASAYEAGLAGVLDALMQYESEKYHTQRPLGICLDAATDMLDYADLYARQLQKYASVDTEHLTGGDKNSAGCFTAYRLSSMTADFAAHLTEEQQTAFAPILSQLQTEGPGCGYPELLAAYHSMPVIGLYGASSSRGVTEIEKEPLTEQAQGEALVAMSRELARCGFAGEVITSFQDSWTLRSWNTSFAKNLTNGYLWHDLQTATQSMGLLGYKPGREAVAILDGKSDEWTPDRLILENESYKLYAVSDAEGLYLYIEGAAADKPLYLPVDISPSLGSFRAELEGTAPISFDGAAEFLLILDGADNSRLLVQERYDAMRECFLYETTGEDPFSEIPAADSPSFVPVYMVLENDLLVDVLDVNYRALQRLGRYETGRLTAGSADPNSPQYTSLCDLCFSETGAELRLPWLLLNVADPANGLVHSDYYLHYGVEWEAVRQIRIGVGDGASPIPLGLFSLKGWKKLEVREYLKDSYDVMAAYWKGER